MPRPNEQLVLVFCFAIVLIAAVVALYHLAVRAIKADRASHTTAEPPRVVAQVGGAVFAERDDEFLMFAPGQVPEQLLRKGENNGEEND